MSFDAAPYLHPQELDCYCHILIVDGVILYFMTGTGRSEKLAVVESKSTEKTAVIIRAYETASMIVTSGIVTRTETGNSTGTESESGKEMSGTGTEMSGILNGTGIVIGTGDLIVQIDSAKWVTEIFLTETG